MDEKYFDTFFGRVSRNRFHKVSVREKKERKKEKFPSRVVHYSRQQQERDRLPRSRRCLSPSCFNPANTFHCLEKSIEARPTGAEIPDALFGRDNSTLPHPFFSFLYSPKCDFSPAVCLSVCPTW